MCWRLSLILALTVITLWMGCGLGQQQPVCICKKSIMCRTVGPDIKHQVEVIAFDRGGQDWKYYDWMKITTVVVPADFDPGIICYAHAYERRVIRYALIYLTNLNNENSNKQWVKYYLDIVKRNFLDGLFVKAFDKIGKESKRYDQLNDLMLTLSKVLHKEIPGSQITFSAAWSPNCMDGRCYDFFNISESSDYFFVQSYGIPQDQRTGCIARPSSPYLQVLSGLTDYIRLGISPRKLVMGVAWFGRDFPCTHFFESGYCAVRNMTFDGIHCSEHVASQLQYKEIMELLPKSFSGRFWDDERKVPYFVYMVNKTYHEVWYDDPESISMKATLLKRLKLGGIGMWAASYVAYNGMARTTLQTMEMWNALCPP
ncbi:di-N-acetylchitobiase-like isoform X1 [Rhinoraja longicauda]